MNREPSSAIGRAAAMSIVIEVVVFALSLIWEVISPSALAQNLGYVTSLLLVVSVVAMMTCFHHCTPADRKVFGLLALVSSIIYAPFCASTYFLQLSTVALNPLGLSGEILKAITFKPGSPIFALDMLGYGFLCLSTLATGFALTAAKDRALRLLCFVHGTLAVPTLASPILSGIFLSASGETGYTGNFLLMFWCVIFAPIALLFVKHFSFENPEQSLHGTA